MDTPWFYHDGIQRQGPVSLEALLQALAAVPDPGRAYVWQTGMAAWQPAETVAELAGRLPPMCFVDAEAVAKYHRRLVLFLGTDILLQILLLLVPASFPEALETLLALGWLVLLGAAAVTAYQLARKMRIALSASVFWGLSMLIPWGNLFFAILLLGWKAQNWGQDYGLKFGLLGPTRESLAALERRLVSSRFE